MASISDTLGSTPEKIKIVPGNTPTTKPMKLNACKKFNLCSELSEGSGKLIKGLAPV